MARAADLTGEPGRGRRTILQGGRRKAYRPLPLAARRAAFEAFLAACARGEWFEAHELLEPAWMGTDHLPERDLHQGLIKIAAANVHGARGNPRGMTKNLIGARDRLAAARDGGVDSLGLDLSRLIAAIDERLVELGGAHPDGAAPILIARPG